jgi:hypothetical protein
VITGGSHQQRSSSQWRAGCVQSPHFLQSDFWVRGGEVNAQEDEDVAFDEFVAFLIKNNIIRPAPECGHCDCVDNHFTTKIGDREFFLSIYMNGFVDD